MKEHRGQRAKTDKKNIQARSEKSPSKGGDNESEQNSDGLGRRGGAGGARRLRAKQEPGGNGLGVLRQVLAGICPGQRREPDAERDGGTFDASHHVRDQRSGDAPSVEWRGLQP